VTRKVGPPRFLARFDALKAEPGIDDRPSERHAMLAHDAALAFAQAARRASQARAGTRNGPDYEVDVGRSPRSSTMPRCRMALVYSSIPGLSHLVSLTWTLRTPR